MKAYKHILTFSLILFGLVSCQDEIVPQGEGSVKIKAEITPALVTRVFEDGTSFSDNDVIRVQNLNRSTENIADYKYSSSSRSWSTSQNLFWDGKQNNEFNAWYPATAYYNEFDIPLGQSSGTSCADWMTASATAKQSDGAVSFRFSHQLSKITVTISGWGSEYGVDGGKISAVQIATASKAVSKSTIDNIVNSEKIWVNSYAHDDCFDAIVAPGTYSADSEVVHIYLEGTSNPLIVKTKADINLQSGMAYNYKVTVGKDAIVLDESSVLVTDWIDEELESQNLADVGAKSIDLSAQGTANSYIVSAAGAYKFTPTKGNSSQSVGTIHNAEVLWESFGTDVAPNVGDLIKSVRYENGCICFETPSQYRKGNAVIAAKDASGTILWSWHIWLTDQPAEHIYPNNAGVLMDRNLGATSTTPGDVKALGLLYQWGRKDPFLGSSRNYVYDEMQNIAASTGKWTYTKSSEDTGDIDYATQNPTTLIYGESYTYNDWVYETSEITRKRWCSDKTIYDPCPAGWRVPNGGSSGGDGFWANAGFEPSTYDAQNYGVKFSVGSEIEAWYPASGHYPSGYHPSFSSVGFEGAYWTATISGFDAYSMVFSKYLQSTYAVNTSATADRGHAYSIRCFKEGSAGAPVAPSPNPPMEGDYVDDNGVNHGQGVSIDGVVWAPVNVGATSNEKFGSYYTWYQAHQACPEGWRLPLDSEITSLSTNSQTANIYSVDGRWLSGSKSSTSPTSAIFLPHAGDEYGHVDGGYYWSGAGDRYRGKAHILNFYDGQSPQIRTEWSCTQKLPVRCVMIQESEVINTQRTIDGLTWSTRNVGAEKITDAGNYYTEANVSANFICPEGWRVPTFNDFKALKQNYSELVIVDGVQGRWMSGSNPNANSSTGIFLPLVGYQYLDRDEATKYDKSLGMYWSGSLINSSSSYWLLSFDSDRVGMDRLNYSDRATPIRCVKGSYDGPTLEEATGTNSTQVEINGLTWSSKNVGAESINDYGDTFIREEAMNACPQGWRLPTEDEVQLLINNYSWDFVQNQSGILCSGYSTNVNSAVFLPTNSSKNYGYYWTSSEGTSTYSPYRSLAVGYSVGLEGASSTSQYAVRCVKGSVDLGLSKTEGASYTVILNPSNSTYGWQKSTSYTTPNVFMYDGLYESANWNIDNSDAVMYIDIEGYENFTIYLRNNGESGCDYTMVSHLDKTITTNTSINDSAIKMSITSKSGATSLSAYKEINYTGIDKGKHRITVVYRKDSSEREGTDRGYVMIPIYQ